MQPNKISFSHAAAYKASTSEFMWANSRNCSIELQSTTLGLLGARCLDENLRASPLASVVIMKRWRREFGQFVKWKSWGVSRS